MAEPAEVRMCPKCGVAEVVLVTDWKHTTNFGSSGESTQDFRCQQCGRWYIKKPKSKVIAYWILGVIFLPTCGLGLIWIWLARQQQTFDRRVQVVQGAPVPPLRFEAGPPRRDCGKCEGGVAVATKTTRHTHNGLPTGTDHVYTCGTCGKTFEIEDALGHSVNFFLASCSLGAGSAFFFISQSPGWKWGGGVVCALIAGLLYWQGGERLYNRFKHKAREWKPPVG